MDVANPDVRNAVPLPVRELVARLSGDGASAWLVGGTVRDLLLGDVPRDFDVATTLRPEQVASLLPEAELRDARYGTCRVASAAGTIAVTTLRAESGYRDQRRPDAVQFVHDPAVDAKRRDFTCNALYLDVRSGAIVDPTGGLADLRAQTLRAIGDPDRRFAEDTLRLLRAVRFAARCGLGLDPATRDAAVAAAPSLARLSPERTFAELTDMFTSRGRGHALHLLVELGFADVVLPEVAAMRGVTQPPQYHPEGDVLVHVALVLDHVPPDDPVLAWSAVLHDVGKPPTWRLAEDRIRFDGHDTLSATMADAILARFHAPLELRAVVAEVCREHIHFAALPGMRPAKRERWLRGKHFAVHLAFHRADCLGSHGKLELYEFAARAHKALGPVPEVLVTGSDVLALGLQPGPMVGKLLAQVHAAADEAPVPMDRAGALRLLRELVEGARQDGGPPAR